MGKPQQKEKEKSSDELTFISPVGRACFPHVWEPHAFKAKDGEAAKEASYKILMVFDGDADLKEMKRAAGRALVRKFGKEEAERLKKKFHLPFRDASEYSEHGEPFEEGRIMVNFDCREAPGVVDERAKPILKQSQFYAGCLARVSAYAHAYEFAGKKGVKFLLNNVQKTGDGERLSASRKNAEDEFRDSSKADDDDDDDLFGD
jgi:hypothetical protein